MAISDQLVIRPFEAADQDAAKQLVVTGLGERWGWIDPTLNPDLNDIATTYAAGIFLVGYWGDTLVVTGALLPEVPPEVMPEGMPEAMDLGVDVLRVVRMSVRADLRQQGIGRRMLDALLDAARQQGCRLVVLETTSTWTDAVRFYQRYGFTVVDVRVGETHMQYQLSQLEPGDAT